MAEEKQFNPRLTKTKEEFIKIMDNLNLPYPKKIGESIISIQYYRLYSILFNARKIDLANHRL